MAKPVLEITTLVERPEVIIDKTPYEILSPDELPIVTLTRFGRWGNKINELSTKDRLTTADKKRLTKLLYDLTDAIMVGVPDDVRAKLSDQHRLSIAETFTMLQLTKKLQTLASTGANPTGGQSQPGSNGSTAGTPTGGSTVPQSGSSGHTPK